MDSIFNGGSIAAHVPTKWTRGRHELQTQSVVITFEGLRAVRMTKSRGRAELS